MKNIQLYENFQEGPMINEQSEKEDFHKKLEEVLNYAGDRSESVYMALYNKLNDWMETDKDEQQFQNDTV
jgi:hypothetical protein